MSNSLVAPQPPSLDRQFDAFSKRRLAVVIAACVGAMATFLPWAHAPIIGSVAGTQGDGWLTLALFAPALIASFLGDVRKPIQDPARLIASLAAAVAGAIGAYKIVQWNVNMADVAASLKGNPFAELATMSTRIGIGLYLLTAAGFVVPVIAYWTSEPEPASSERNSSERNSSERNSSSEQNFDRNALGSLPVWLAAAALLVGLPLATLAVHRHRNQQRTVTFASVADDLQKSAEEAQPARAVSLPASWPQRSTSARTERLLNSWERSGDIEHAQFSFNGCRPLSDGRWIGEMTNNSARDYKFVSFKLSLYNDDGELVDTAYMNISNFKAGQTRSFDGYTPQISLPYKYKIDFENGF